MFKILHGGKGKNRKNLSKKPNLLILYGVIFIRRYFNMRSFQFSKYCLVALMCLGLFACSTASQNKPAGGGGGNSYNEEGLQSNGIGDEADFSNGRGKALKTGSKQIYYFFFFYCYFYISL